MRLNTKKCKTMANRATDEAPVPKITLDGQELEEVDEYKYLGIVLNNQLKWDKQWDRVKGQIRAAPYVVKALKRHGFRKEVLVNVYRSIALSHVVYSAPLLLSASAKTQTEMSSYEKRMLKIIGTSSEEALTKYSLKSMEETINNTSLNILKRILGDDKHPLTSRLERYKGVTRLAGTFKPPKARTAAYKNSLIPWGLRFIRNGVPKPKP